MIRDCFILFYSLFVSIGTVSHFYRGCVTVFYFIVSILVVVIRSTVVELLGV